MNIHDFIREIEGQSVNVQFADKLEEIYGTQIIEYVKKLFSVSSGGVFFESADILRLLSHKEILDATKELNVDFIGLQIIPIFDTGDNDYIVFDIENNSWCKFNIVDSVKYKHRSSLNDFFRK